VPTVMVATTASVAVSITLTVPDMKFATYAIVPSGVMATSVGRAPTVMVSTTALVAVSIALTVPDRLLATNAMGAVGDAPAGGGSSRPAPAKPSRTMPLTSSSTPLGALPDTRWVRMGLLHPPCGTSGGV